MAQMKSLEFAFEINWPLLEASAQLSSVEKERLGIASKKSNSNRRVWEIWDLSWSCQKKMCRRSISAAAPQRRRRRSAAAAMPRRAAAAAAATEAEQGNLGEAVGGR